jgi:nucleoside-diphosphate-sugar epimerase
MIFLVTGGAGFIGSNIVTLLLEKGHTVRVIDNLSSGNILNIKQYIDNKIIEFLEADILDYINLLEFSKGVDVIFHLAASVGRQKSIDNPLLDSSVNLLGTINVLEAMRANNIKKIVYSSSAAIYGELQTSIIDEDHPQNADSPYGVSKLAAEKMILAYASLYDFSSHCLRYFNIYGINQRFDCYGNVIPIFAHRMLNNEPITIYGDGEQTRDFINVKDVAIANYMAALSKDKITIHNIGCGKSITINKLAKIMFHIFNKKPNIIYAPPRKGDVLHCKADINKVQQTFHFFPSIELENGLVEYIAWFRNNN